MDLLTIMPPFWAEDPALAELIGAVGAAVNDYLADVQALLHSGAVSTAVAPWLREWEFWYGTSRPSDAQDDDRRAAVMAKMRGRGICSLDRMLAAVASFYSGELYLEEDPENSKLIIWFTDRRGTPDFVELVKSELSKILPVHLELEIQFEYLTIAEVESMTLTQLEQMELYNFAGGTY